MVRLFLYQGANIEATCKRGRTPLIWDVISDVVALLLEHGANIESRCIDGNTPLLNAVSIPSHGSYDGIVRLLLENNADVHALNNDRWTPLLLAACYSTETVLRLFWREDQISIRPTLTEKDQYFMLRVEEPMENRL